MYQPTALSSSSSRILLDPRLFAQIHLDHRLLGSHLQGCALHKTAGYVLEVLRLFTNESNQSLATTLINKLEHKAVLENISAHFQTLMGLAFKIDEIQQRVGVEGTSAKSLEDFQQKYITPFSDTIFEQLKREGNILIPGGWAGSDRYTPGHAMIYQFIKNEDNSYRFIIYNTGSGLQYHQPVSGAKDKYIPLMEYQIPAGTDVEEIKKFLTNLITPRIAPKLKLMYNSTDSSVDSSWEGKKIYNARRIYEEVIPNNLPKNSKKLEEENRRIRPTQGQLSGTCPMFVLIPLLKINMGAENAKQFYYALKLQSIQDYFGIQKQNNNLEDPVVRRQLLQAIRGLSIKTGKLSKRYKKDGTPIVSQDKAKEILRVLDNIGNTIKSSLSGLTAKPQVTQTLSVGSLNFIGNTKTSSLERQIQLLSEKEKIIDIFDDNAAGLRAKILEDKLLVYKREPAIVVLPMQNGFKICYKNRVNNEINTVSIERAGENKELCALLAAYGSGEVSRSYNDGDKIYDSVFEIVRKHEGTIEYDKVGILNSYDVKTEAEEKMIKEGEHVAPKKEAYQNDFFNYVKAAYEAVFKNNSLGYSEAVLVNIENLFLSLPVDRAELDVYFKQMSREQLQEALTYFQLILRIYGKTCGQLNPYASLTQSITGYTALLIGYFITNHLYDNNPTFQKLTTVVMRFRNIWQESFDPRFDKRSEEFDRTNRKLCDAPQKPGCHINDYYKSVLGCSEPQDYYDSAFLKYRSLQDTGLKALKDKFSSSHSDLRQHLYQALQGKGDIALNEKTRKDYDAFFQFQQIQDEYEYIRDTRFDYFNVANTEVNKNEYSTRASQLKCELGNRTTTFQFENEQFVKKGKFYIEKSRSMLPSRHYFKMQNDYMRDKFFFRWSEEIPNDNLILIKYQRYCDKHSSSEYIARTLPFTFQQKDCKVAVTKDFFESNLEELNKHDYQKLLLCNFFAPGLLEQQINNNIHFVNSLKFFLQEAFRHHVREENIFSPGGLVVLELQYFLLKYLQQHPNRDASEINSVITWLEAQNETLLATLASPITKENKSVEKKLLNIYFLKVSLLEEEAHKEAVVKQNLVVLFRALFNSAMIENHDPILAIERLHATQKLKTDIQKQWDRLPDTEKKAMLCCVLKDVLVPDILKTMDMVKDEDIILTYPVVQIQVQDSDTPAVWVIAIDLSLGTVMTDKGRLQPILPTIYHNMYFSALFGQTPILALRQDKGDKSIFTFNYQDMPYRVIKEQNDTLHIQTKPPGEEKWFERINTQDIYTVSGRYSAYDCQWWRETGVTPPSVPTDYCSTAKEGYLLKIKRDASGLVQTCSDLQGYQYVWDNKKENAIIYDIFRGFESSENIEVWGAREKIKVKLSRYNLEWEAALDEKGLLEYAWSNNKDFILLLDHPPIIAGFSNLLYMKNKRTGEKIAIIPKQAFYVENLYTLDGEYYALKYDNANVIPSKITGIESPWYTSQYSNFISGATAGRKSFWYTVNTQQYYQFSVVDNEVFANTAESYLHLAYIYLAKHDPENAMWALQQCSEMGALQGTEEEVSLVMKIMKDIPTKKHNEEYYEKAFFKDPETTAVRLYAAWLLAEQKQNSLDRIKTTHKLIQWPQETGNYQYKKYIESEVIEFYERSFWEDVNAIYQDYRQVFDLLSEDFQLDYSKRFSLLSRIQNPTQAMKIELAVLQSILAKESKKQFLKKVKQNHMPDEDDKTELENLQKDIEHLHALVAEAGIKEYHDMESVLSRETLSALQDRAFVDMRQFLPQAMPQEKITPSEISKEQKVTQDFQSLDTPPLSFLERQQEKMVLDLKVGRENNEKLKNKLESYKKHFTKVERSNLLKQYSDFWLAMESAIKNKEKNILWLSNKYISGAEQTLETQAEFQGNIKSELQLGNLIWLYLQGDQALFLQETRITDTTKIQDLYLEIHQYLLDYTEGQHQKRVLKYLDELVIADVRAVQDEDAILKLGNELNTTRQYEPNVHPEMLVFEYAEDKRIRKDQVEVIEKLLEKLNGHYKNLIFQLIMGFGKSKLLLPIMALKRADGTNLSVITMAAALFGPGFSDLSKKTNELFGKKGFPFIFNCDSKCDSSTLNTLYQGLLSIIRNRDYVATTPEAMKSLQLKYLALTDLDSISLEIQAQITHLENILKLFRKRADALIDECDTALDFKKELNHILGASDSVDEYILSNILKIFEYLEKASLTLASGITCNLKEVMLRQKEIVNEQDWDTITEKLAEVLIVPQEGLFDSDNFLYFMRADIYSPEISLVAKNKNEKNKAVLLNYLLDKKTAYVPTFFEQYDHHQRNNIDLVKGILSLIKICFKKKPNVSYGFPKSVDYPGSKYLSIVYTGSDQPDERLKFQIYETIIYTILRHNQLRVLPRDIVFQFILDFKSTANQELLDKAHVETLTFNTTLAAEEFKRLTGLSLNTVSKLPLESGAALSATEQTLFEYYRQRISEQEKAFNYILQKYILSDIKVNKRILRANRVNHVSQYRSASAISGTPGSAADYHERFELDEASSIGVDGVTIDHLINKDKEAEANGKRFVLFLDSKKPEKIIDSSVMNNENFYRIHAFIDVGIMFEGTSNLKVAQLFVDKYNAKKEEQTRLKTEIHKIKYVLYFNAENRFCALPLTGGANIVIDSTDPDVIVPKLGDGTLEGRPKPEEWFMYYDQLHTTGIDIEHASDAIGILSLDADTRARDCWQGAMRFRKLSGNQTIQFVLPKAVSFKKIGPHYEKWNFDDIRRLLQSNGINQSTEVHLRVALANTDDVSREYFLEKLFNCSDFSQKITLRKKYSKIFELPIDESPHAKFGMIESVTAVDKILSEHVKILVAKFVSLEPLANLDVAKLNTIKLKALENCLEDYKYGSRDTGTELEIAKEKENEKEKESETWYAQIMEAAYKSWDLTDFPEKIDWNGGCYKSINIAPLDAIMPCRLGFSNDIFVSENYQNTYIGQEDFVGSYIKPLTVFLVIKYPHVPLKILLITQGEFKQFVENFTQSNHRKKLEGSGIGMWLVSAHDTVICGTSDTIDNRKEYAELLSQIHYFNADLDMLLKNEEFDWLFREGTIEKMDFLENVLLKNYPEKKKWLSRFKHEINEKVKALLFEMHNKIDVASAFEGVKNGDLKAIDKYISEVNAIKEDNLKRLVMNFNMVTEGGKALSLLGLAIKRGELQIVEKLIHSDFSAQTFNIDKSPLLLALLYKQDTILQRLLEQPKMYPPPKQKHMWFTLLNAVLNKGHSEILKSFLFNMKQACDPKVVEQLISKKIEQFISATYSDEAVLKILDSLGQLTDDPFSAYKKYITSILNVLSPDKVLHNLCLLYDNCPSSEMRGYLAKLGTEIDNPDMFMKVFSDERFTPPKDDIKYWAELLHYHASPGSYLYVLNKKEVPKDLQSLIPMGKFPALVVTDDGNPRKLIFRDETGQLKKEHLLDCTEDFAQIPLLLAYVRQHQAGEKNVYLKNNHPILNLLVPIKKNLKSEILEFLLHKVRQMDDATRKILLEPLNQKEAMLRISQPKLLTGFDLSTKGKQDDVDAGVTIHTSRRRVSEDCKIN